MDLGLIDPENNDLLPGLSRATRRKYKFNISGTSYLKIKPYIDLYTDFL